MTRKQMRLKSPAKTSGGRTRRRFSPEFKTAVVCLVLEESKTKELDRTLSALSICVARAQADSTKGRTRLTTNERMELARLRKKNRELRVEREVLRKATALFARIPV